MSPEEAILDADHRLAALAIAFPLTEPHVRVAREVIARALRGEELPRRALCDRVDAMKLTREDSERIVTEVRTAVAQLGGASRAKWDLEERSAARAAVDGFVRAHTVLFAGVLLPLLERYPELE